MNYFISIPIVKSQTGLILLFYDETTCTVILSKVLISWTSLSFEPPSNSSQNLFPFPQLNSVHLPQIYLSFWTNFLFGGLRNQDSSVDEKDHDVQFLVWILKCIFELLMKHDFFYTDPCKLRHFCANWFSDPQQTLKLVLGNTSIGMLKRVLQPYAKFILYY